MNLDQTIVALATGVQPSPRMILRVDGPEARALTEPIVVGCWPEAGAFARVKYRLAGMEINGLLLWFGRPNSYTGQDLAELHLPGSPILADWLLKDFLSRGARMAEPGEFTARAFFNGRLDLTAAEGVAAVISASGQEELDAGRRLLAGELSSRLRPIMDGLINLLASIEAGIDFADEPVEFISHEHLLAGLQEHRQHLQTLLAGSARMEQLTHLPTIVLAGRPNAGKSTLLNTLTRRRRAVISPVAGTTRDVLSATLRLRRGSIVLQDIAGLDDDPAAMPSRPLPSSIAGQTIAPDPGQAMSLRAGSQGQDVPDTPAGMHRPSDQPHGQPAHSSDTAIVEPAMQHSARQAIGRADGVILVHAADDSRPRLDLGRSPDLILISKLDRVAQPHGAVGMSMGTESLLGVSATTGQGMDQLLERLDQWIFGRQSAASALALNSRHWTAIEQAIETLQRTEGQVRSGQPAECTAADLRQAIDELGQVLGLMTPDDVLGRVFSRFCIGK